MAEPLTGSAWLIASHSPHSGELIFRLTKTQPRLHPGEIPLQVSVQIPASMFETPELKTTIVIPERDAPIAIDTTQVSRAVTAAIGMNVVVTTEAPDEA